MGNVGTVASHDIVVDLVGGGCTVTVDETLIRESGWIRDGDQEPEGCLRQHCDDETCDCTEVEAALEVLERWHNEAHSGVVRFCDERPCSDFREARKGW